MPNAQPPEPPAEALLAERERLRALWRGLPVGLLIVDAGGRRVEANPAAEALWGREGLAAREEALARALREGPPGEDEEVERVAADGTPRTVRTTTTLLRDAEGALLGAAAVGVDVTPRGRAERAEAPREEHARLPREARELLRAGQTSRVLLESFIATAPVGMAFLDRELRYVHINPVLAAINGLPVEAHLGRHLREVLTEPGEATYMERLLRGVMERGEPLLDSEGLVPARPGLPPRPVRSSFFPVRVEEEVVGVGAVILDVTEQNRVEEGLRFLAEASARLTASLELPTTLENTARLVVERMADYCLVDVLAGDGRTLERLGSAAREPEVRAEMAAAMRFPPPPGSDSPMWQVLETGRALLVREVSEEVLEHTARDAEHRALLRWLKPRSVLMVPLVARGHTVGLLTAVSRNPQRLYDERDLVFLEDLAWRAALAVDNARLYQRAEQAVAARDEFVAIATHELRTPLSALHLQLMALQRAVDGGPPPSPERLGLGLTTARRQTERLSRMLNQLLDVSRLSTGRLELEREPVDLSELARQLVNRFEEPLEEAGCAAVVLADAPVVARVDRLRVEQVLTNLLSNSMKYAPGQPVELSVTREGPDALVAVRDYGPGISPEARARIFDRFQRASGTHGRESLGLGLYVSRQLARAHGGELSVESAPGPGTHFLLRLPLG